MGLKVDVEIIPAPLSDPDAVQARVIDTLYKYFAPLDVLDERDRRFFPDEWNGWQFGTSVYQSAIFALLQQLPGVQNVLSIQIHSKEVDISTDINAPDGESEASLKLLKSPKLALEADMLVVSLGHQVSIAEL